VVDYKKVSSTEELAAALKEGAPEGIDMYFDNVRIRKKKRNNNSLLCYLFPLFENTA
jgi:hypothetical protein